MHAGFIGLRVPVIIGMAKKSQEYTDRKWIRNSAPHFALNLETAKVLGLRIGKLVQIKNLQSGLSQLNSLYNKYKLKASKSEKQELKAIKSYVLLSILLQAFKRGNRKIQFMAIIYLLLNIPGIVNRKAIYYYINR